MQKILIINRKGGCGKTTLALSLADVLEGAKVVDLDNQKTITQSSELTGRHVPVGMNYRDTKYLIIDTPPYEDLSIKNLLAEVDKVLIPSLVGYPDLLGCKGIYDFVLKKKLEKKTTFVFNKVRLPRNNSYKEIKGFFLKNYPKVNIAATELTLLRAYQDILAKPLSGTGLSQVENLVKEIFN